MLLTRKGNKNQNQKNQGDRNTNDSIRVHGSRFMVQGN